MSGTSLVSWIHSRGNLVGKGGDRIGPKCHHNTTVVALEPHSAPDVPGGVSGPGFPAGLPSPEDGLCWSQHTAVKLMFALLIDINDLPFTAQHPCSTHPH